jgi:NAD(P)-dependent dehydrogenase (short-subunit alcohol dehydrogenase family)
LTDFLLTPQFQLNTIGPIFFTKAMIPQLQKGTEKRVVNIGSFLGSIDFHKATQAYAYVSYSAAKLALSFATLKYAQE